MSSFLQYTEVGVIMVMTAMMFLILRGLLPVAIRWSERDAVWHFAAGLLLVVGAMAMRSAYWVYMPFDIRQMIGKETPNIVFGLFSLYGGYLILKLQWLIIPDIDRGDYTIWNAPWYPRDTNWQMGIILRFFRKRKEDE